MAMSDNIADMLTRIRNAQKSRLISAVMPKSNLKCSILNVLKKEGYICDFKVSEKEVEVELKYSSEGFPVIQKIEKVSKSGKRMYSSIKSIPSYFNNMGIHILSTSKGVITDREAKKLNVGGEVICRVF